MRIEYPIKTMTNYLFKTLTLLCFSLPIFAQKIDRKAVVERHIVKINKIDTLASLSIGNGKFAFTVDATGLQTFPDYYANGVPLGTQSEWGWHSFPNTGNYKIEETFKDLESHGRKVLYAAQWNEPKRKKEASDFIRQNPHRLQLGNVGLELYKKDNSLASPSDIQNINQTLNPYTGEIKSHFTFEGTSVDVLTYCDAKNDIITAKIQSSLLKTGQIKIRLRLAYPTDKFIDAGNNWVNADKHLSKIIASSNTRASINHTLDKDQYFVHLAWTNAGKISESQAHYFLLEPSKNSENLGFTCEFSEKKTPISSSFGNVMNSSVLGWKQFWQSGGAIDLAGSTDPRANELERQIILSEYLTKLQCAGSVPPQETGLTYNSWFGKPHLEMHWWHGVHFALWGRVDLLEKSLAWYNKALPTARIIAKRQGFEGARWPKMTDNNGGETSSSVGSYLIWQQPHIITFVELVYRQKPNKQTLEKYKQLVFETADFMTSFADFDKQKGKYILGKGIISAQERFKPEDTFNPTYELNYWYQTLTIAQIWRKRLGMKPNEKWQHVIDNFSPLPQKNGVYLATENAQDSYTNPKYLTDHPAVLCTLGMLPETPMLDKATMKRTFEKVWELWDWQDTWGWDFPMVSMTATRLDMPQKAIDGLMMPIRTNTYLANGHNFQDGRLRLYLPGNGGLLTAVALMCAGYDGCQTQTPGFPKDGTWKVKWEGMQKFF